MKTPLLNIAQGQAGVYRVVAELITRGHAPYLPVVDTGVDILLAGNIRLQVKTTMRSSQHVRYRNAFLFTLSKAQTIRKRQYVPSAARVFSEHCDFVVLCALEADRIWIVPAIVLDRRHTVAIFPQQRWRDLDMDAVRGLQAQGLTVPEIAARTGFPAHTLRRRLAGKVAPVVKAIGIQQYEGRWDLIDQYLATLSAANRLLDTPVGPAQEVVKQEQT